MNDMERLFIQYGLVNVKKVSTVSREIRRFEIPVQVYDSVSNNSSLLPYFRRVDSAKSAKELRKVLEEFVEKHAIGKRYKIHFIDEHGDEVTKFVVVGSAFKTKIYQQTASLNPQQSKACVKRLINAVSQLDEILTKGDLTGFVASDEKMRPSGIRRHVGAKFVYAQRVLSVENITYNAIAELMFPLSEVNTVKQLAVEGGDTYSKRLSSLKGKIVTDGSKIEITLE